MGETPPRYLFHVDRNIQIPHYKMQHPKNPICNMRVKHMQHYQHLGFFYNIHMKHLQHSYETFEHWKFRVCLVGSRLLQKLLWAVTFEKVVVKNLLWGKAQDRLVALCGFWKSILTHQRVPNVMDMRLSSSFHQTIFLTLPSMVVAGLACLVGLSPGRWCPWPVVAALPQPAVHARLRPRWGSHLAAPPHSRPMGLARGRRRGPPPTGGARGRQRQRSRGQQCPRAARLQPPRGSGLTGLTRGRHGAHARRCLRKGNGGRAAERELLR
jgi:hypothetical protein